VLLLSVCAAAPCGNPSESRAHALELATEVNEAVVMPDRPSCVPRSVIERTAPPKAYDVLAALQQRSGVPLPGYIGGKEFRNRERRLPHGRYREYDVNRKIPGRSRGAERLVIEQRSGKAYYTGDHYRTFIPLN
jgi:ribonuclease T1